MQGDKGGNCRSRQLRFYSKGDNSGEKEKKEKEDGMVLRFIYMHHQLLPDTCKFVREVLGAVGIE